MPCLKGFEHSGVNANHIKPIDMQTLPIQALQPLHDVLDPDLTSDQRELVEQFFVGISNSPVAQACTPEVIAMAAVTVMEQISHVLGGRAYYISKMENLRLARLKRSIHSKFTGNNHRELAREHGITTMRVRQILNWQQPKKVSKQ